MVEAGVEGRSRAGAPVGSGMAFYLAILAATALLQLAAVVGFAATHYFVSHSGYAFDAIAEQKATVSGQDADVLFVGSSAVATGVDPAVIQSETGLSAFNLGVTASAFAYDPDFLVDRYLARNKQPRIIVFYLTPTISLRDPAIPMYEAAGMILRHGSWRETAGLFLPSPWRLLEFAHQVLAVALDSDWNDAKYRAVIGLLQAHAGFVPMDDTPGAAKAYGWAKDYTAFCAARSPRHPPDADEIRHFRQKYTRPGTAVLIFVAPLADCDKSANYYAGQYAGVADNLLHTLPHDLFVPDAWRVHLKKQGAELNSRIVGEWLLERAWSAGILGFAKPGAAEK